MTNNTLSLNPNTKKAGPASPKPPLRKKRQQEVVVSKGPTKRFVPQKPPARQQRSLALETPKSANGADANVALERRRQQAVIEAQARKRVEDEQQKQEARRYEELEREAKARAEAEEIAAGSPRRKPRPPPRRQPKRQRPPKRRPGRPKSGSRRKSRPMRRRPGPTRRPSRRRERDWTGGADAIGTRPPKGSPFGRSKTGAIEAS